MTLKELRAKRAGIKADIESRYAEHNTLIKGMWANHKDTTEAICAAIALEDANAVQVMVRYRAKVVGLWVATRCSRSSLWARPIGEEGGERRFRRPRERGYCMPETWDCKEAPCSILVADALAAVAALEAP